MLQPDSAPFVLASVSEGDAEQSATSPEVKDVTLDYAMPEPEQPDESSTLSQTTGIVISIDDPTRLVVRVEPITAPTPSPPTPNAVRSPLPYRAPDAPQEPQEPQERSAPMEITAYQQPSRPAEVTWCDVCAPFAGAAFERALSWAASHGMTAVDMLDQYRAQCR
jgi:hypothetical protein